MRVALVMTFAASRKEPLATMLDRVHQSFLDGGTEPLIRFNFGDGMIPGGVSSVDRVLKRHPELARFVTEADPAPGIRGARRISNGPLSAGAGESVPYSILQEIAAGVPRSFPFHGVSFHLFTPEFGDQIQTFTPSAGTMPGVLVSDSWWVNGRNRSLSACVVVEAEPGQKKLPPYPPAVATVLAACGKPRKTVQLPLAEPLEPGRPVPAIRMPNSVLMPSPDPEKAKTVHEIVLRYRQLLPEIVSRTGLPHDLPDHAAAHEMFGLGVTSGPKKPALESVFKPLGYSCKGEAGDFVLTRRTAANHSVHVSVGIGSWGHSVTAHYVVLGMGFKALLMLPPGKGAAMGQYPVGDAAFWQKIVENLAALVAELDRTFVPEIEAAAGPSPDWYKPVS